MDENEMARLYYMLLTELRLDKRMEASKALSEDPSQEAKALGRIGQKVFDIVMGQAPATELEGTLKEFDQFPLTSFWSRIMETTGQEMIRLSYAITAMDEPERQEMISHALRFIARAQDGGFLLCEHSLKQLRGIKKVGGFNSPTASELIARNGLHSPDISRILRLVRPKDQEGGKRKADKRRV